MHLVSRKRDDRQAQNCMEVILRRALSTHKTGCLEVVDDSSEEDLHEVQDEQREADFLEFGGTRRMKRGDDEVRMVNEKTSGSIALRMRNKESA